MFTSELANIINTNQSRSVVLTGNVQDIFYDGEKYVPLVDFLSAKYDIKSNGSQNGKTLVVYEVNSPIEIRTNKDELEHIWNEFRGASETENSLDDLCERSNGNPTMALEFLRQLTICSRKAYKRSRSRNDLLIIIESVDMLVPDDKISSMSMSDRKRVAILHDWFSDPEFTNGPDSVLLISESTSLMHSNITRLPQMLSVAIDAPDFNQRRSYINHVRKDGINPTNKADIVRNTAGLSLQALRQLLCKKDVTAADVTDKVEQFIVSQLGDAVEFLKPSHTLEDVVGFKRLKTFITSEMIPRIKTKDIDSALPGAAVGGPIGGGKTFTFLAVASELGIPVLVLKNLRSMWFGQTDVVFERLRRVLSAMDKVLIFVDEADTQFGGIGEGTHDTERRLTGKVQAMMSDPDLRGKVIWLLMTARINLLSPDIRRPGRVGDLIIPVLDPEGEDRDEFFKWVFGDLKSNDKGVESKPLDVITRDLQEYTAGYSAASFTALRSLIKAKKCTTLEEALEIVEDMIPPDIGDTREYQTLQAQLNCTRCSLLFDKPKTRSEIDEIRNKWRKRITELESKGVR